MLPSNGFSRSRRRKAGSSAGTARRHSAKDIGLGSDRQGGQRLAAGADLEQTAVERFISQRIVIALAHLAAEHGVDAVEMKPHQRAGAVDRVQAALPDVAPFVELGP